jgi:riboflavin synthase
MFTGIVTDVGRVKSIERRGDTHIAIATAYDTRSVDIGASIACSGPCLTVVEKGPGWFGVTVSAETLACTTLGQWREGTPVNLERSLKVGAELGGHIVTGHVDGVAEVVSMQKEGESTRIRFRVPAALNNFVAPKGAIAVEGVSLTVNEVEDGKDGTVFGVNIIPHTASHTTLGALATGSKVNIEIDVLARYVARLGGRAA